MLKNHKTIVVVGAGGRLGCSLVKSLKVSHCVIGLNHKQLDLGSIESIDEILGKLDYNNIIIAGALTNVDYCESHENEAFAVNTVGPGRIAEISTAKDAHVTYISTDMVFDGSKAGSYVESDKPNPINAYGASKLAGEKAILHFSEGNLVVRTSWIYGPGKPAFPEWIIGKACSELNLTLPMDKMSCPTYTLDIIEWLLVLLFRSKKDATSGIFHLCNSSPCSWLDWGQFCIDRAREFGFPVVASKVDGVSVDSVHAFLAKRPVNSAMDTEKFRNLTGIRPREWTVALRDFVIQSESFSKYRL